MSVREPARSPEVIQSKQISAEHLQEESSDARRAFSMGATYTIAMAEGEVMVRKALEEALKRAELKHSESKHINSRVGKKAKSLQKNLSTSSKSIGRMTTIQLQDAFLPVDQLIWLKFQQVAEAQNGRFMFVSLPRLSWNDRKFLDDHTIPTLEISQEPLPFDPHELRREDVRAGHYNCSLDSHRFGYKMNDLIAMRILKFLLDRDLVSVTNMPPTAPSLGQAPMRARLPPQSPKELLPVKSSLGVR